MPFSPDAGFLFHLLRLNVFAKLQLPIAVFIISNRKTEQSTRIRVLLPDSMTFSVNPFLRVASAILLLLCSPTSCLGSPYATCLWDASCGGVQFGYPFGKIGNGCGDPDFQLQSCDNLASDPQLIINGDKYHLLSSSFSGNSSNHTITIVNDNLFEGKCNLSGNYSQFWRSASQFHLPLADTYTNLTLWRPCTESNDGLCDGVYYFFSGDPDNKSFCGTGFELPIQQNDFQQINVSEVLQIKNIVSDFLIHGFEVGWEIDRSRDEKCGGCMESYGICGYNVWDNITFRCYCSDGSTSPDRCPEKSGASPGKSGASQKIIIGCSIAGVVLAAIAVLFYVKKRKTRSRGFACDFGFGEYERKETEAVVLHRPKIGNLPIFSYEELRQATNSFHEDNEIGDGGFGSVYLGKLRDGRTVAVKRLYQDNSKRIQQFINEVEIFSSLNHPYVVRLYGCTSADSPELLLVYEFVSNGTLADHLHGDRKSPKGLPWDTRLNIAIQTAQALAFLHSVDPPIFHRDVKSSNILLDENFNVKIADFGLSRLVPLDATHVTTAPQGTPGYVDPEYHQCFQLTEKSDVYSFGVVLVEIISAKLAVDINRNRREINLAFMAISKIQEGALHELVDPQLEIEKNDQVKVMVSAVAELAFRCLASEGDDRPDMKEVVAQLEEIRGVCPTPGEQWGSFHSIKQILSPTSVQDKWPSLSSTPNNSA